MKSACLITIGNELLSGHTVNTNAAYLGQRLLEQGIPVTLSLTIGDDLDQIVQSLQQATSSADVVIISGGARSHRRRSDPTCHGSFLGRGVGSG